MQGKEGGHSLAAQAPCEALSKCRVLSGQGVNHTPRSARWAGPRPCPAPRSLTGTPGSGGTGCGLLEGPVYLLPVPRDAHPGHANAAVSATLLVPQRVRSGPMSCCGASAAVW